MPTDAGPRPQFRPQAVRGLQSPDRQDSLASVTDAKGWVAVVAGCFAVVVALCWGIFGSIPDRVEGPLVLVRAGQVIPIVSPVEGVVSDVVLPAGASADEGAVIVRVRTSDGTTTDVVTPSSGTVEQVMVGTGLPAPAGTLLATVLSDDPVAEYGGVTYVGPQVATELAVGQTVTVTPSTVDVAEYGRLLGRIVFVGSLPSRSDAVAAEIQNEPLAELLTTQADNTPYLVRVEFDSPPRWTNDDPPGFDPTDGTLSQFSVIVASQRPIDLVFGG